jgi:ABC-type polar amino acid transport system ATPase subunit
MSDEKLSRNPLDMPDNLLYESEHSPAVKVRRNPPKRDVVLATFSLYPEDVVLLNELLAQVKSSGKRGANKSRIVRQALARFRAKDFKSSN